MHAQRKKIQGCERDYVHDDDVMFEIAQRRNILLARWAAGLLKLKGAAVDEYVEDIMLANPDIPTDDDVASRILFDLENHERDVTAEDIRLKLEEFETEARRQLSLN